MPFSRHCLPQPEPLRLGARDVSIQQEHHVVTRRCHQSTARQGNQHVLRIVRVRGSHQLDRARVHVTLMSHRGWGHQHGAVCVAGERDWGGLAVCDGFGASAVDDGRALAGVRLEEVGRQEALGLDLAQQSALVAGGHTGVWNTERQTGQMVTAGSVDG